MNTATICLSSQTMLSSVSSHDTNILVGAELLAVGALSVVMPARRIIWRVVPLSQYPVYDQASGSESAFQRCLTDVDCIKSVAMDSDHMCVHSS